MSHHHFVRELVYGRKAIFFSKELLLIYNKIWVKLLSLPLFSGQLLVNISAKENIFDQSATWACLIWEKSMQGIAWKMESRNVLSQTNFISKWMPVLSYAQPGEYTYKNISYKVEKYSSTFDNTYKSSSGLLGSYINKNHKKKSDFHRLILCTI